MKRRKTSSKPASSRRLEVPPGLHDRVVNAVNDIHAHNEKLPKVWIGDERHKMRRPDPEQSIHLFIAQEWKSDLLNKRRYAQADTGVFIGTHPQYMRFMNTDKQRWFDAYNPREQDDEMIEIIERAYLRDPAFQERFNNLGWRGHFVDVMTRMGSKYGQSHNLKDVARSFAKRSNMYAGGRRRKLSRTRK